jgi:hypothetical protein
MWIAVFTFAVTVAIACGLAAVFLQSHSMPGRGSRSFIGDLLAPQR